MPTYKLNQLLNNVKFALYFKISLEEGVEERGWALGQRGVGGRTTMGSCHQVMYIQ